MKKTVSLYASHDYLPFFIISDSEWPLKKLSEASPFQKELEWELERPEISNEFSSTEVVIAQKWTTIYMNKKLPINIWSDQLIFLVKAL